MTETHGHAGWHRILVEKANRDELTLSETMALCLHNIQNHLYELKDDARQARLAAEHTEGMLGAIDQLAEYIAIGNGLPYAASGKVREALDRERDQRRNGALETPR